MEGNGDGTFTPTYTVFDFDQILVPQLAADLSATAKPICWNWQESTVRFT
jgi:hypothetical protein